MAKNAKTAKRSGAKAETGSGNQVPPTRATGAESATGQALAAQNSDIPQGEDRGSKVEQVGGEAQADYIEGAEPQGAQAEPAKFTSNGQLEHGTTGSPSGPVPIATKAATQEEAEDLAEKQDEAHDLHVNRSVKDKKLDDRTVARLGRAELAAIGAKRGYDLPEAGTRATRAAFASAQDKDKNLIKD